MQVETLSLISLVAGYLVTLVLIRWVVLLRNRQPVSAVAWIMAIVFLPYVGGVLFLFFGVNRVARRAKRKLAASRKLARHLPNFQQYRLRESSLTPLQRELSRLAEDLTDSPLTVGNSLEILADTEVALSRIEQAISGAQDSIHLEYYIWQPDRTGTRIRDLLIAKARAGVRVRFLYDQFGSWLLNNRFLKPMREAGVLVAPFLPGTTLRERWSINLRSHRKIVIADGQVGFTGGMNIGDEYLGRKPDRDLWRDTHLRFSGPLVLQLQQVFVEDWYYATQEEIIGPTTFPQPSPAGGGVTAHVLADGPDSEVRSFYQLFFAAVNQARRRITLATSYFVPPEALLLALENAARRGVEVRLLLPGRSANPLTLFAARSYYDSLLQAGVKIHEFTRGILHSKTLSIDEEWCLVGTPNFDARSLLLNFEVAVAAADAALAKSLDQQYEQDLLQARAILPNQWPTDASRRIFLENACRLLSPVM